MTLQTTLLHSFKRPLIDNDLQETYNPRFPFPSDNNAKGPMNLWMNRGAKNLFFYIFIALRIILELRGDV